MGRGESWEGIQSSSPRGTEAAYDLKKKKKEKEEPELVWGLPTLFGTAVIIVPCS